ncbi:hypothetical protein A966_03695 [Brachyspira hampsonii 30446]|uniref:DUF3108 domain-containing protein n=3 Tax=Brachyspira hampsonii TaxID=1287055 RepID=A0A2U4EX10_9SPIR|nr:hypothetical protein [Brachyspira hampsonii]EKV57665.1 hypothetical protein A966_03695 [Brachyspira hampsonii 30446]OEJ20619.1 hypothetical protein A9495_11090 [Brachyspira hampsonii]
MKNILIIIFILNSFLFAQYYSYTNIPSFQKQEYFVHKGISSKKSNAMIVYTETSVDSKGYWNIKETYIKGFVTNKLKDPFLLEENMMTNVRKSEMYSIIDLANMRTVYNKTIDYYDFGNMEHTFDIRDKVNYTNSNGDLAIFSMYGVYQISRTFPIDSTNQMNIIMPMASKDSKLKVSILNNGIKKIKINNEEKECYEMEIKLEGIPFSIFFPKIAAYIEKDDKTRKIIKYNTMTGMLDTMDIYLVETEKK